MGSPWLGFLRRTVLLLLSCALCGAVLVSAGTGTARAVVHRRTSSAGCGEVPSARPPDPLPEHMGPPDRAADPEPAEARADVGAWPYAGYEERLSAARRLACFGAEGVAELRSAARHGRPEIRAVAARKLSWVVEDDLRCLDLLLDDGDWSVRFAAGLSLLERASHPVASGPAQPLVLSAEQIAARLARGPRPARADVRRVLALVLADGAQESAPGLLVLVPALGAPAVDLLRDLLAAPELRQDAMRMLGRCGELGAAVAADLSPSRYLNGDEKREAARALLRLQCRLDEALPVLAEAVSEAKDEWRPFVPLLRKSLAGTGPIPSWDALWVVRNMGPAAAECLPDVLALSGQVPRDQIISALATMGGSARAAMPWILAQLGGYDPPGTLDVPATEFAILGRLRYGPMDWTMVLSDEPDDCGMATSDAVVLRGAAEIAPEDPALVREALARLDDAESPTREAATLALRHALATGRIGLDPIVARMVGDSHDRIRRTAASVLGHAARGREDVVARLAELLDAGDSSCQQYAARALADAGAQEALAAALDARSVGARTWAAAALLLPRGEHVGGLAVLDDDEAMRAAPWRAHAFAVIESSMRAEDPAIRRIAAHVAGARYWPGGWDALATAARDPDSEVRRTAEAFLNGAVNFSSLYPPMELEPRSLDFHREPDLSCAEVERTLRASLASSVRAEERWIPVDLVELADGGGIEEPAASALLEAIAADPDLHAFERWCAARALDERR